jgi:hypothetical protein
MQIFSETSLSLSISGRDHDIFQPLSLSKLNKKTFSQFFLGLNIFCVAYVVQKQMSLSECIKYGVLDGLWELVSYE